MDGSADRVSIVVPTYNERENIPLVCDGIREALDGLWDYEVIVVDDNSPDGTGEVVRRQATEDPRIRLLQRPGRMGLGSAVLDGFRTASGSRWVIMDADLSHRPDDLPKLLNGLGEADIVIGSRHVEGGQVLNWPLSRRLISRTASALGRLLLGLPVRDVTSGFAAFRRDSVGALLPTLNPRGFKLLIEVLAKARGASVKEVPITFVDRQYGRSKFGPTEVVRFIFLCIELRRLRGKGLGPFHSCC